MDTPIPNSRPVKQGRIWRIVIAVIAVYFVFEFGSCWGTGANGVSRGRVLFHSDQPKGLSYQSGVLYELRVEEGPQKFNSLLSSLEDRYAIIDVGRKGDNFAYVHSMTFDITGGSEPSSVNWTNEGINLTYPSGHKLFIPKKAFIGGR